MPLIYGGRVARKAMYQALAGDATVVGAVGEAGIVAGYLPEDQAFPCVQILREAAQDDSPLGPHAPVTAQTFRFQVRVVAPGESDEPLVEVAEAMHLALHGLVVMVDGVQVLIFRVGELPFDLPPEEGTHWQQLGGVYEVQVIAGG